MIALPAISPALNALQTHILLVFLVAQAFQIILYFLWYALQMLDAALDANIVLGLISQSVFSAKTNITVIPIFHPLNAMIV